MEVLGYSICANLDCQRPVLSVVAFKTGGLCESCARSGLRERLDQVVVSLGGAHRVVSTSKRAQTARNRRQYLRRKGDSRLKARKHAAEKAKTTAWKRLAALAPELYALILADERERRGLTPISVDSALQGRSGAVAWETLDVLAFYRSLTSPETAPDDPHEPTPHADAPIQGPSGQ